VHLVQGRISFSRHHIIHFGWKIQLFTSRVYWHDRIKLNLAHISSLGKQSNTTTGIIYSQQTKLSFHHHGWFVFFGMAVI